uniref:Uncharacterized protein n=1 Tax=Oryza barthii TaxID=65489 RepID=A0A0D3G430_9ORYZ
MFDEIFCAKLLEMMNELWSNLFSTVAVLGILEIEQTKCEPVSASDSWNSMISVDESSEEDPNAVYKCNMYCNLEKASNNFDMQQVISWRAHMHLLPPSWTHLAGWMARIDDQQAPPPMDYGCLIIRVKAEEKSQIHNSQLPAGMGRQHAWLMVLGSYHPKIQSEMFAAASANSSTWADGHMAA